MISKSKRKSLEIKYSGRSTDFITPSIIMGCGYNCTYCYCKRHKTSGIDASNNLNEIITEVNNHAYFTSIEKPNQTHPTYITYDLGCNTDMSLHHKLYDWKYLFDFFKEHDIAFGSFATKYVNKEFLNYNSDKKIRIRYSLMPEIFHSLLEQNTSTIIDRINAINDFIEAGYEVHINYSPVIVYTNWLQYYKELFEMVDKIVKYKDEVKAEVIFLTHNEKKHNYNLNNNLPGEHLLWNPNIQENKISQYGGENIRYKHNLKYKYIEMFKALHNSIIPWNKIRYIF